MESRGAAWCWDWRSPFPDFGSIAIPRPRAAGRNRVQKWPIERHRTGNPARSTPVLPLPPPASVLRSRARSLVEGGRRSVDDRVLVAGAERPGVGELAPDAHERGAGLEIGGDFVDLDPACRGKVRIRERRGSIKWSLIGPYLLRNDTGSANIRNRLGAWNCKLRRRSHHASLRLGSRWPRVRYSRANLRLSNPPGSSGMRRSHCS